MDFFSLWSTMLILAADVWEHLMAPEHGHLTGLTAVVGQYVVVYCMQGYWFERHVFTKVLLCESTLEWNDTITDCEGGAIVISAQI